LIHAQQTHNAKTKSIKNPLLTIANAIEQHTTNQSSVATVQLGGFLFLFLFFISLFVTENAVIDITIQEMVTNIAPLHTFQILKKLSKYMQPILKYSKNNMWFF
jgi:hypothetical protein